MMLPINPLRHLAVPEHWASLEDFAQWYVDANFPMAIPYDYEIFTAEDGLYVFSTFRQGRYQVELYVIEDKEIICQHEHPFVEVIQLPVYICDKHRNSGLAQWGEFTPNLKQGMAHGGVPFPEHLKDMRKTVLFVFQKWPEGVRPSTISVAWKGKTMGPKHEALIRRFFPDAYLKDGFADITRGMPA